MDPLTFAHSQADATADAWERQESVREAASAKEDRERETLASHPHSAVPAMDIPGFCRCGYALRHSIHDRKKR